MTLPIAPQPQGSDRTPNRRWLVWVLLLIIILWRIGYTPEQISAILLIVAAPFAVHWVLA